jgi:pilus assembly protein Flp/PilA
MSFIKAFLKDESGATMIEYGLVAALVSVAAIIALQLLGAELQVIFNTVSSYLASADRQGRHPSVPPFVFAWSRDLDSPGSSCERSGIRPVHTKPRHFRS